MSSPQPPPPVTAARVSRRAVLAGALGTAAAASLAGCASGDTGAGQPLRVAFAAGGSQESLDPHVLPLYVDQARAKACFDTLTGWSQEMTAEPRLAQSWEPDATGRRWRVRLRSNRFHDGRPLTSADVLHSFRRITDPATTGIAAALFGGARRRASRQVADHGPAGLVLDRLRTAATSAAGAAEAAAAPS